MRVVDFGVFKFDRQKQLRKTTNPQFLLKKSRSHLQKKNRVMTMTAAAQQQFTSMYFHGNDFDEDKNMTLCLVQSHKNPLNVLRSSFEERIVCTVDIQQFQVTVNAPMMAPGFSVIEDEISDKIKTHKFNEIISPLMGVDQVDSSEVKLIVALHNAEVGRIVVDRLYKSIRMWSTISFKWRVKRINKDDANTMVHGVAEADATRSEVLLRIKDGPIFMPLSRHAELV